MDVPLWHIILHVAMHIVFLVFSAFVTAAEVSIEEIRGAALDKLTDSGDKHAAKLAKMLDSWHIMSATFASANILALLTATTLLTLTLAEIPLSKTLVTLISIGAVIVITFLHVVFGDVIPRRLGSRNCERYAVKLCGFANLLKIVFTPAVSLILAVSHGILRIFGIDPNDDGDVMSEEDIRMIADASSEQGEIDEDENEMIQNVFEFDDTTVGDIATHRTELHILWEEDPDEEWEKTVRENIHSYYPICGNDIDHVTGFLDAKKYFRLPVRDRATVMKAAVFRPRFVAQVMKADMLFKEMKRDRTRIAVVVDEYGGTYGLVTMNDLIEQIVGDLGDDDEVEIIKKGNGFLISGLADIEKLDELFGIETESESTTVGGWVMEHLEKIPEIGDSFTETGIDVKVTKANDKRVIEVYAEKLPEPSEEE